jgi:type IV secretion system protein VirB7
MKKLIVVFLLMAGCSHAGPYVTGISPAGNQGLLVEKCSVQMNPFTGKVSTGNCNTSYVWLGGANADQGGADSNPNNNVITIK